MTRPPIFRAAFDGLVVDSFAGGGGASTGIEAALGRPVDIAINHDPEAIAMHAENHPATRHFCESVWKVDPMEATGGRPVALAWFSPDCKHFSRAKGTKPVEKKIRGLAWVVIRWARAVQPRVILLENVEEFETWGPLVDGRPCPVRRGRTFRAWVGQLRRLGYEVEWRSLRACDFGAPTTRKRLYLIARCDGEPIRWPDPTHGPGREQPWRVAAECIEWALPCPSIFERSRPLADATLRRIAEGVRRYVLDARQPFLLPVTHQGGDRVHAITEPFRTITSAHRGEIALASPTLIQTSYGEREGQAPRVPGLDKPLGTVVAGGVKHALVTAFLARHFGGMVGIEVDRPLPTITAKDHHSLVTAELGERVDQVRAFLTKYNRTSAPKSPLLPFDTVTTRDRFGLVTIAGRRYEIADIGLRMLVPRELYRAQGFPESYVIDPVVGGARLTKTAQTRMVGNSVAPPVAEALVRANVAVEADREEAA